MKTTNRTILDPCQGRPIPVTIDLNIKPLMISGKHVINGKGQPLMDDQWFYESTTGGAHVNLCRNLWRSRYCQKMYMAQVTIQESIGANKLMDSELKEFCEKVSDKIVFQKHGKWYRIFLYKKTSRTFGIEKISLYRWTLGLNLTATQPYDNNQSAKVITGGLHDYMLAIDWRSVFFIN